MEKMDIASRQRNLKFLGIYESTRNDKAADIEELVGTLSYFCDRKWVSSDVEETHRIGPTSSASRRNPRPLIATFRHVDDKLAILRDRDLREALRQNAIRVAADLTPRQREEIQHYKKQGKTVYDKNGRLHVEIRWQQDNTKQLSTTTRRRQTGRYERVLRGTSATQQSPGLVRREENQQRWPAT